jgi:hypothetical protein
VEDFCWLFVLNQNGGYVTFVFNFGGAKKSGPTEPFRLYHDRDSLVNDIKKNCTNVELQASKLLQKLEALQDGDVDIAEITKESFDRWVLSLRRRV